MSTYDFTIKFNGSYSTNVDNFTITLNGTDGTNTTYATGVSQATMVTGYNVTGLTSTISGITATSTGICTNSSTVDVSTITGAVAPPAAYTVTGSTQADSTNSGSAHGQLIVNSGHTVTVTLTVFSGTAISGSNSGSATTTPSTSLNLTQTATYSSFPTSTTQSVTLSAGTYNFNVISSYDSNKYAKIAFVQAS
jgi:hypothetical protein